MFWVRTVALVALVMLTGCESTKAYLLDRGNDALDVFTLTAGVGLGANARIGPVHAGLFIEVDAVGLRNGEFFLGPGGPCNGVSGSTFDATVTAVQTSALGRERRKAAFALSSIHPRDTGSDRLQFAPFIMLPSGSFDELPSRSFDEVDASFYTQIEVGAGVLVAARAGFNPGELVDFLLGWFGIDIYGDDIHIKALRESPKSAGTVDRGGGRKPQEQKREPEQSAPRGPLLFPD